MRKIKKLFILFLGYLLLAQGLFLGACFDSEDTSLVCKTCSDVGYIECPDCEQVRCLDCEGGVLFHTCSLCNGTNYINLSLCSSCDGAGVIFFFYKYELKQYPCNKCSGSGFTQEKCYVCRDGKTRGGECTKCGADGMLVDGDCPQYVHYPDSKTGRYRIKCPDCSED